MKVRSIHKGLIKFKR